MYHLHIYGSGDASHAAKGEKLPYFFLLCLFCFLSLSRFIPQSTTLKRSAKIAPMEKGKRHRDFFSSSLPLQQNTRESFEARKIILSGHCKRECVASQLDCPDEFPQPKTRIAPQDFSRVEEEGTEP